MATARQVLILCLLAVFSAALVAALHPKRPPWQPPVVAEGELLLSDAKALVSPIWVDARSATLFAKGHIPGAINLNLDDFSQQVVPLLERTLVQPDATIVIYCDSDLCQASHEVAERLRDEFGMAKVYVLKGGWEAWLQDR